MNIRKVLSALCLAGAVVLALGEMSSAAESGSGPQTAKATFAGGCFWSVELLFDKVEGENEEVRSSPLLAHLCGSAVESNFKI